MKRPRRSPVRPLQLLDLTTLVGVTGGGTVPKNYGRQQTDAEVRDMNASTF